MHFSIRDQVTGRTWGESCCRTGRLRYDQPGSFHGLRRRQGTVELPRDQPQHGVSVMRRIGLTSKIPTLVVALVFLIPCVSWADLITPTQEQDVAATLTHWGPNSATHPV